MAGECLQSRPHGPFLHPSYAAGTPCTHREHHVVGTGIPRVVRWDPVNKTRLVPVEAGPGLEMRQGQYKGEMDPELIIIIWYHFG